MKKQLFIIGVKHCGKSTVGKLIAKNLNLPFFDLDTIIETKVNMKVRKFFKTYGKIRFQKEETKALHQLLNSEAKSFVCATGGGICDNPTAFLILKECYNIYINTNFETLYKRISQTGTPAFLKTDNPKEEFRKIYKKRNNLYTELANTEIDGNNTTPLEIKNQIISELRS